MINQASAPDPLHCSFCNRNLNECVFIVHGMPAHPDVAICGDCVLMAEDVTPERVTSAIEVQLRGRAAPAHDAARGQDGMSALTPGQRREVAEIVTAILSGMAAQSTAAQETEFADRLTWALHNAGFDQSEAEDA